VRRGLAFVAIRSDGAILLRERPPKGLLGGMLEVPSSPWQEAEPEAKLAKRYAPMGAVWRKLPGLVEHSFTHFHLELAVYYAPVGRNAEIKRAADPERCRFVARRDLASAALPSVMRKVLSHAFAVKAKSGRRTNRAARASPAPSRARRRSV
jgi:A/G-specific adenine glycosylase